ncbi:hypothetical protein HanXRQr2_Chr03g0088251 [Helianthus annuus]|uniref:Uncharacterized protein n=2 Tax=Helianthus annuus TaxID=4232 RepID=A0A9K3NU00_HELAN|nr:hypothetical protein HanXRQr2_Chr03g0088251 [Helianthus annuus]KAJ0495751.1 hypothetical protein HanIR_Chr12g0612421 [Helianthus annuus]KAJ0606418.1 hypothetical protein HanHA89_Chr03g0084891 [Helianthus annuus]KAJ0941833.1 hypothetical protein HanPSC8_Chr03g0084751 [Helianthus annuus]
MAKHMLQFALFAAFSLWLLYQIRQPTGEVGAGSQLSNDRLSNFMGRKGSAGLSKSTVNPHSGLTLEDVTNPGEEGEIPQYSKEIESVEFHTNTGSSKEGNDQNTLLQEESLTMKKSNISFPDENGIPQHVRDKFIGKESNNAVNNTRVKSQSQSQSVIATRVGKGRNGAVEES